jgi:hypothetical protein
MEASQEWCPHCGAGVPGSLATRGPSWRATATMVGATMILVVAAATAAYAALSKKGGGAPRVTATVAQAPAPAPVPAPAIPPIVPTTTAKAPRTAKPTLPPATAKPPKIPLTAATPKATKPAATTPATTTPNTTTTAEQPTPITVDTNAVTTYNPDGSPPGMFGDPSLAVDGDVSTGWTAQVDPAIAPRMAAGLLVDLKTPQRLSSLALITSTPGMTVQVFAANGTTAPASITDPGWAKLSPSQIDKKRHVVIKLRESTKAFRFVTLWISRVPAASIGTPEAPGRVSVNEVELFPAK